jgi:hypothetical protein
MGGLLTTNMYWYMLEKNYFFFYMFIYCKFCHGGLIFVVAGCTLLCIII